MGGGVAVGWCFFFSSRRRHTRFTSDWSSDVCSSDLEMEKSVGLALLEPHINYTNHVFAVLDKDIRVKGVAHITGGGLVENIPRILPNGCDVEIHKGS